MKSLNFKGIFVLLLILIGLLSFSALDYVPKHSIYNDNWNGTSLFKHDLNELGIETSRILISPLILEAKDDINLMIIIGSDRKYSPAEIDAYRNFVDSGGTLIIFEDFGPARSIAEAMGISFFTGILRERDENLYVNRPSQFFVKDLASQLVADFDEDIPIMVAEAAGILDAQGFANGETFPILLTYPTAYVDRDEDNEIDANDIKNQYGIPVGLYKTVGNGNLIVISDSSIPLNQYWDKTIEYNGQAYKLLNSLWTLFLISSIVDIVGTNSIVFDESHQEISVSSATGIFNLIAGTWVGLVNTAGVVFILFIVVIVYALITSRHKWKNPIKQGYGIKQSQKLEDPFISHPTLAERSISEQYILYQNMGNGFVQIANTELVGKIRQMGKGEEFLENLENKYGNLDNPRSFEELIEIHIEMRNFVDDVIHKYL